MRLLKRMLGWESLSPLHSIVAWTIAVQLGTMVFSTGVSILVSRKLGADGRGIVSWMMAFSGFGVTCVVLGMGQALKKYIAKMPAHMAVFIVLDFMILAASLLIFMPLLYYYGGGFLITRKDPTVFFFALLLIPYQAFSMLVSDALIGLGRGKHANILFIFERGINISLNLALVLTGWVTPLTIIGAYFIAQLCRAFAGLRYMRPYIQALPGRAELWAAFSLMRQLIMSAYVCNLAMYFAGALLTIVLGSAVSSQELGYFAISKFLVDIALMLPAVLATFTLPHFAQSSADAGQFHAKRHILLLAAAGMCFIALPMFFFPHIVIRLLFGSAFMPGALCLHIMSIGMIAAGIISVAQSIIASQHQERFLIASAGSLAFFIVALTVIYRHALNAVTASYIYSAAHVLGMLVSLAIIACTQKQNSGGAAA